MTDVQPFERPKAPWSGARGLAALLSEWDTDPGLSRCFTLRRDLPAKEGEYAAIPDEVDPGVRAALKARGVERLYAHQARAFELVRWVSDPASRAGFGRDVVIATPTASGKSLCYNLPVLDCFARDPAARALYLFPTKALSRDQEEALRAFMREAGIAHGAITYDGDTPGDARRAARERSGVLLTNPDMLHAGVLPHHASWARLFANLRYVVIDELHTYRGVFGSHLANVLRRLHRIAKFHGSDPRFVFASATIGNPKEHAMRMLGRDVELIDESGAPQGPRRVMVFNPPVVNPELGIRASYLKTSVRLAGDLVSKGVPTLVFGQSRNTVETMLKYLRERLAREKIGPEAIHAYRGGYLPDVRRRIEAQLRSGEIKCVVATNALELGIDIGCLDAVVCAGYPGSVASLFQRFGRGGRRQAGSLALLVASSAPLDQFIANESEYLVGAPVEQARIDPDNVEILVQHLKCAAFELPFEDGEPFGEVDVEVTKGALEYLVQHEVLQPGTGSNGVLTYHWATHAYPANHVSLRSASWDNFVIVDLDTDKTIAEMDFRSTHTMLHVQAIYQHEGEQYQVERLDFENHKAFVRHVKPDYYTTALTHVRVSVLDVLNEDGLAEGTRLVAGLGDVSVVEKVVGYKKIKFHTHENVGYGDVHLPEMEKHTSGFWLTFPEDLVRAQPVPRPVVIDALRAFANALHTVAAVGLMIDPRDLGKTLGDRRDPDGPPGGMRNGAGFDPTIFLYDSVAGGIGLAPRLFEEREQLVRRARKLVEGCGCKDGCPACIGPSIGVATQAGAEVIRGNLRAVLLELLSTAGIHAVQ